ncbi:MAG: glycosyltransferase family 4 protein [Desulfobulbia bacterium]
MKKIALAIENFNRFGGGAESYAVELAETLIKEGWEVHLFGERWGGEPKSAVFHSIHIPAYLPSWLKILLFAIKHKQMIRMGSFDVVLGFGNTICMNLYQSHGGVHWLSTFRKVYCERNPLIRFFKRLIILLSLKQHVRNWIESSPFRMTPVPRIIAISDMIRLDYVKYYRMHDENIDLIYNGIDTEKFNLESLHKYRHKLRVKFKISDNEVVFVFVSYDLRKKGIEPLVKAVGILKQNSILPFRVLVVGGYPYPSLQRMVQRLGLVETIIFVGPSKAVQEIYAASDVFVLPTYYDACSLVVLEAMLCGLPAITTEYNGIAGILSNGKNSYVISHPPDCAELAARMRDLLSKEKRSAMSQEALVLGRLYTKSRNHNAMLKIINEVAAC